MEVAPMTMSPSSPAPSIHLSRIRLFRTLPQKQGKTPICSFSNDPFSGRRQPQQKLLFYTGGRDGEGGGRRRERVGRGLVVVAAAGKKKKASHNKPDTHSFAPKPDEVTGPFPEAVLLKKKIVQEDGRVLPEFADAEEEKLFEFLSLQLETDLNVERVRHYEVVYLIHEDHVEEVDNVVSKVQDFIREKKGRIWRLNNWGLRRLAYRIKKAKNANYILMNFELEAKCINEFKSMLDKDERIIRHLVIKRDEAITEDCPPPLEFHTLRAGGMDDENDEDEYGDVDADGPDGDDEDELDIADDFEDSIIFVDEEDDEEEDEVEGQPRGTRTSQAREKIRAVS